ncbi:dipeptidase [Methylocapsa palsarum]|uniref:Acetylornithine deacetylase/Succinyl-diaminopimelate desuccinylase n=1 Tax=Methylocapsa palsarum TaxID=1612308 RepID=A0A1I4AR75_9HYPH|nr:dipeptidase [Methylocapsa palsarum]SFK58720.1 Acetylornithine deacetylase/Succinyl-diaminopimelate desuccinylase [Methylocapsa palsarum]
MGARLQSFGDGQGAGRLRRALGYARANRPRFVADLQSLIRFASVSAQPSHSGDMANCAAWLARHLREIGLERVTIDRTGGQAIVRAEWRRAEPGAPTVLIYGHYDVQPAEPLDDWRTPPFDPIIRGDDLHGRGASDDKGQMFAHVKAIESWLKTAGALPVNLICLFEGEEEIGSPHLSAYLTSNRGGLAADCAIVSDMQIPAPDRPAITYSLRGGLSVELQTRGQKRELHSGVFGGAVHNPVQALCEIIARLHDGHGRIAIPGFYRDVREWDAGERAGMREAGPSDAAMLREAGATHGWGEPGYTLYERTTIRPALTVCGVSGGYNGPGVKAAIPARALAKLNFRLAPDQDPAVAERLFRDYIARVTPPGVQTRVRTVMRVKPASLDRAHPGVRAAARAYRRAFGAPAVFLRSGGTIPVVGLLQEILGAPVVLMGFGLPGDRIHGPNEKFSLSNFHKGVETSIGFLAEMGAPRAAPRLYHSFSPVAERRPRS